MQFGELVEFFDELEATSSNLAMTTLLAQFLESIDDEHSDIVILFLQGHVFPPWESAELGVSTSLTKAAITKATGVAEPTIEEWWADAGDLGIAAEKAVRSRKQQRLVPADLTVKDVHDTLVGLVEYTGEGSQARKIDQLAKVLSAADPRDARYIVRIVLGTMRLGVGAGTVRDAIAEAFLDGSPAATQTVERAYEVTNDFRVVVTTAKHDGCAGLEDLGIAVFRPIKVMLAEKAATVEAAYGDVAAASDAVYAEYKYDGMRVQIHATPSRTELFTRRLETVTAQFPEIVQRVDTGIETDVCILEGEVVAFDPGTHEFLPFQSLSQRIKRKHGIDQIQRDIPVVLYVFDVLYLDEVSLLDRSLRERLSALADIVAPTPWELERAAHRTPDAVQDLREFYRAAVSAGHEGIVVKNLDAAYQPGRRVGYMMKVKPTMEPLDLVVTRAQWSEGRKSDWLGRLFLACREESTGEFREVGRMATGMTDEDLEELTARLQPLVTGSSGREVEVKPELVVEVEYEEIQGSPRYDSGFALRFPRFRRFRDDLSMDDIDTLGTVEALYDNQ